MANEVRLIDANAFRRRIEAFVATARYKGINNVPTGYETCNPTEYMRGYERGIMDTYTVAVEQPQVDAVEVVHGKWEQVQRWATKAKYRCSVCGREIMSAVSVNIEKYPHCHCGAKMDGDTE